MQSTALTVADYLQQLPPERLPFMEALRDTLTKNWPKGFVEEMNYGMIGYVVPHKIYPDGYHCNPKQALPFINIASQKTLLPFTTWACMPAQPCYNGLQMNTPNTAKPSRLGNRHLVFQRAIAYILYLMVQELT